MYLIESVSYVSLFSTIYQKLRMFFICEVMTCVGASPGRSNHRLAQGVANLKGVKNC